MKLDEIVDGWPVQKQTRRYSFTHIKNGILNRIFNYQGAIKFKNSEIIDNIDERTLAFSIGGDNYCNITAVD